MKWLKAGNFESDNIRKQHIQDVLNSKIVSERYSEDEILEMVLQANDFTLVLNYGDTIGYYEFWADACWNALYEKPEYENLEYWEAIDKFVKERLKPIISSLGLKFIAYTFNQNEDLLSVAIGGKFR